jgi:hypothetical protein
VRGAAVVTNVPTTGTGLVEWHTVTPGPVPGECMFGPYHAEKTETPAPGFRPIPD